MSVKKSDMPIKSRKQKVIQKRNLEDCEPGATREEVLQFIEKVATSPKPCSMRGQSPAPTSK
jgi:hypothetical protein